MQKFTFRPLAIPEIILIETRKFDDNRGFFVETYNKKEFEEGGITENFVQDNYSFSYKGVVRGLHFSKPPHQTAKLVRCVEGKILDVAVDVRPDSKTFGKWVSEILSEENKNMLFIPKGFAHGFCVITEKAGVSYKVTDYYYPESEVGIIFNDPNLNINWPKGDYILSEKDKKLGTFKDLLK